MDFCTTSQLNVRVRLDKLMCSHNTVELILRMFGFHEIKHFDHGTNKKRISPDFSSKTDFTGFHRILPDFTGFHRISLGLQPDFTGFQPSSVQVNFLPYLKFK